MRDKTISGMTCMAQNRAVNKARTLRGRKLPAPVKRRLPRIPLALWLVLVHAFIPKIALGQDSAGEYEVKAAMLYNLTRFVEWPASAYSGGQVSTVLCILGRDPFGDSLMSIATEQMASGGRAVEIHHVQNDKGIRACHVVYISPSERKNIVQILSTLKGCSVLTVGETAQFAARGGMIQFSLEEKQVRLEINLEAASQADLKISSRLLLLARIVKDQNKNPSREGSALRSQSLEVADSQAQAARSEVAQSCSEVAICNSAGDACRRRRQA